MKLFWISAVALTTFAIAQTTPPTQKAPPTAKNSKSSLPVITVFVDDEEVKFGDEKPQSIAGRTLVPMRPIFEALGATVDYDIAFKKITARRDNSEIELTIGEKIARKNGAEITLAVPPTLRGGSTLVPLRFVAESLDTTVAYDPKTLKITIETKED